MPLGRWPFGHLIGLTVAPCDVIDVDEDERIGSRATDSLRTKRGCVWYARSNTKYLTGCFIEKTTLQGFTGLSLLAITLVLGTHQLAGTHLPTRLSSEDLSLSSISISLSHHGPISDILTACLLSPFRFVTLSLSPLVITINCT